MKTIGEVECQVCGVPRPLFLRGDLHGECDCLVWILECSYGHEVKPDREGEEIRLTAGGRPVS